MIKLEENKIWNILDGPYLTSGEIPVLLKKLLKTKSKEIADEIIWEYIYHQGTTYESTLATVPYLVNLIYEINDKDFKLDLIMSLGTVLMYYDENTNLNEFISNRIDEKDKIRIISTFTKALIEFKKIVNASLLNLKSLDPLSKRYFLAAYLVTKSKHKEANVFTTFSNNDEYIFVCPKCNIESFLWNEKNKLNAYSKCPVFNKTQIPLKITLNKENQNLTWLEEIIDKLEIASLKPIFPFFKGDLVCHSCKKSSNVFEGIKNSQ